MPFFADAPEDSEEYLIYPRDEYDRSQIERTEAAIRQILGPNALIEEILIEKDILPKLVFWMSAVNASQVEQIEQLEGVSFVPWRNNLRLWRATWIDVDCDKGCRNRKERAA
jgi:hypothetical protein